MYNTIKDFTDLEVWKAGHELILDIYKITKNFPKSETYGLPVTDYGRAVTLTLPRTLLFSLSIITPR